MTVAVDRMLLPVGHLLGALHTGIAGASGYHRVRIGSEVVRLFSVEELGLWILAHGAGDGPDRWTREAVLAAAVEAGGGDLTDAVDRLVEAGALVEFGPDEAAGFAQRYRFCALMSGLGLHPVRTDLAALGVPGAAAAVVTLEAEEVWRWAPVSRSLAEASRVMAEANGGGEPGEVLDRLLGAVAELLAAGAGYLDVAQ